MKTLGKVGAFALSMILAISVFLSVPTHADALEEQIDRYVDYTSDMATWEVYREGDYLVIDNYDKKRKPGRPFYRTIGFTLSRCKRGVELDQNHPYDMLMNGTATEWIALGIYDDEVIEAPETVKTVDHVTLDHTKWSFPLQSILDEMIRCGYYDWANEVKAAYVDKTLEEPIYLKFDSIMVVCETPASNPEGIEQGSYDYENKCVDSGTCYTNTPPESSNPQGIIGIKTAKGWSMPQKLDYHYNRFFSSQESAPVPPVDPDPGIYFGAASHVYETKNYSSQFNISKAIPAGEEVTNMVAASSFNGKVKIDVKSESKEYEVTRVFYEKVQAVSYIHVGMELYPKANGDYVRCDQSCPEGQWQKATDGNGYFRPVKSGGTHTFRKAGNWEIVNGQWKDVGWFNGTFIKQGGGGTGSERILETVTYKFKATGYYQVLSECNIAALESITVYNNAFPGGSITYTDSLKNRNVTLDITTHGSNRCKFADISTIGATGRVETTSGELETAKAKEKQKIIEAIGGNITARNDGFAVIDNTIRKDFMTDDEIKGGTVTDMTLNVVHSVGTRASEAAGVAYGKTSNGNVDDFISNLKAKRNYAAMTVEIPITTQNLDFPTGIKAVYKEIQNPSVKQEYVAGKNFFAAGDSIYSHVMTGGVLSEHNGGDPDDGYPIRVHTPVVAPIRVVFSDQSDAVEKTQLVASAYNTSANYQLLVDRQYYIEWDNDLWLSSVYGAVEGYENVFDRYVDKKMIRFPFTVVYNGKVYETLNTGYTPWIQVEEPWSYMTSWNEGLTAEEIQSYKSVNHWQMTPIYIPSFANDTGWAGNDKYIEVAVYAKNFTSTELSNDDGNSINIIKQNSEKTQYIATSKRQVQLSGWIYDFSVVGTTNSAMYTGNNLDSKDIFSKNAPFSFAKIRSELKVGTKNRLGTPNIRALADGMYFPSPLDLKQQIPLRNGASLAFSNLGEVWLGQPFAFTLKTMGSLNGKNDSIHIEPSFRYITENGEVLDSKNGEMKMYVVTDNGKTMDIREFDPTDTSLYRPNAISLNDGMFEESFYDGTDSFVGPTGHYLQVGNWATNTANQENALNAAAGYFGSSVSAADIMSRKTYSYNLNHIKIPSTLRYMAGEYEQLQMNDERMYDRNTSTNTLLTYWDTIANYTTTTETKFINSIQQWQSAYVVPTNIYIVDTRTVGGAAFDIMDYIENQTQFSWSTDPIVESKNGKLIIGFDILAYKNGAPYLTYGGGGNNMWLTEEPSTKEGIEPPVPPVPPVPPIIPDETEVVVVNMGKKITDYVEPGIQNIN